MIGLYRPGDSLIHRAPALIKLGALAIALTAVAFLPGPGPLTAALLVTTGLFAIARVPPLLVIRQLLPLAGILAFAIPVQAFFAGWELAVTMALRLTVAIGLATLLSLTTSVTAILGATQLLLRPFRRWVDSDRVGLLLAVAIRCIPLLGEIVRAVLEARRARGAQGSPLALGVPVIVRALQTAEQLGEALIARGVDD